jgi:hypothetical protein
MNAFIKNLPSRCTLVLAALGCLLTLSARATTSVSHFGITWTFSEDRPTGTFANGEPWVVGPVTITNINPNPSQSPAGHVWNGSMKNPTANRKNGFDSRADLSYITVDEADKINYSAALNLALSFPFALVAGDVLVSAKSRIPPAYDYSMWFQTICALTVLVEAPPEGSFRPSFFGTDRTVKWNVNQLNWSVLKNYPAPPSTPSRESILSKLPALPWFEWGRDWNGSMFQPFDNTATNGSHYGRDIGIKFGEVGLWLNTNQTLENKKAVAIQMVQCGLDIYAYLKNGGGFRADGGHKCGRKLPLVFAAMMLNDAQLKEVAGNPVFFQEDQQTWIVTDADVGRVVYTPVIGDSWYGREFLQYRQEDVGMAEWGIGHLLSPINDNRSWSATYRTVVLNGMMGSWLAAKMMEAQSVWNHPAAFGYLERVLASTTPYWGDFITEMISARESIIVEGQPSQVKGLRFVQPR